MICSIFSEELNCFQTDSRNLIDLIYMSSESPLVFSGHTDWVIKAFEFISNESIVTLLLDH